MLFLLFLLRNNGVVMMLRRVWFWISRELLFGKTARQINPYHLGGDYIIYKALCMMEW